ncbi:hypothetical protein [Actinoplanes sp. URMC 104]|uniref:hypothetical protein n=1 Tax=Actinoplanes sp. URMC 104 TaxID=3423409 RepID=UPI003F1CC916
MKKTLLGSVAVLTSAALLATGCAGQDDDGAKFEQPAAPAATSAAAPATPAGNGVEKLTAEQILAKAKAALKAAGSFHMKGSMKTDDGKMGLDFKIEGQNVKGTLAMDGPRVELLSVGKQRFIRPDAAFWAMTSGGKAQAAQITEVVGDRWVKVKANDASSAGMFTATDIDELLDADGKVTKGAVTTLDGKPVVGLKESAADGGTLYVATTGQPYPVRLTGPTPADGALAFTEFGATFPEIKAPAAADVMDLDKLMK